MLRGATCCVHELVSNLPCRGDPYTANTTVTVRVGHHTKDPRLSDRSNNFHARLSDEAREGIDRVLEEHDISQTALLEAAGLYYYAGGEPSDEFVATAKRLTREARKRARKGR